MAQTSKTGYSVTGGGGKGYINIGGWNTTLTDLNTNPQEVVGAWRREGANLYVYGVQGTATGTQGNFVQQISGTVYTCGASNVIPPFIFTNLPAAGTANPKAARAMCIQDVTTNMYGWYFVQGVATVQCQTDTTTLNVGEYIIVATDSHAKVKLATTTAQGFMLTAVACDVSGAAYISLLGAW